MKLKLQPYEIYFKSSFLIKGTYEKYPYFRTKDFFRVLIQPNKIYIFDRT